MVKVRLFTPSSTWMICFFYLTVSLATQQADADESIDTNWRGIVTELIAADASRKRLFTGKALSHERVWANGTVVNDTFKGGQWEWLVTSEDAYALSRLTHRDTLDDAKRVQYTGRIRSMLDDNGLIHRNEIPSGFVVSLDVGDVSRESQFRCESLGMPATELTIDRRRRNEGHFGFVNGRRAGTNNTFSVDDYHLPTTGLRLLLLKEGIPTPTRVTHSEGMIELYRPTRWADITVRIAQHDDRWRLHSYEILRTYLHEVNGVPLWETLRAPEAPVSQWGMDAKDTEVYERVTVDFDYSGRWWEVGPAVAVARRVAETQFRDGFVSRNISLNVLLVDEPASVPPATVSDLRIPDGTVVHRIAAEGGLNPIPAVWVKGQVVEDVEALNEAAILSAVESVRQDDSRSVGVTVYQWIGVTILAVLCIGLSSQLRKLRRPSQPRMAP